MKLEVYKCNLCRRVWDKEQVRGIDKEMVAENEPEIFLVEDPIDCDDHICLVCISAIRHTALAEKL
jgi:hypothetical protein